MRFKIPNMKRPEALIEFSKASISNGTEAILSEVNFRLSKAESCYIVGETGSGKSSFLKSIYAEEQVLKGKAQVLGHDIVNIKQSEIPTLRRKMGIIFQEFQLFQEWSVARNLAYVLSVTDWKDKQRMQNRIDEVLMAVGLHHKDKEPIHRLSGGEQQRVAIARAILNHPKIIVADEPTANLDKHAADSIIRLLKQIAIQEDAIIIIATHDERLIEKFPARVFRCYKGRLQEED